MPTKTIYMAQTFHWRNGRLEPGEPIQFMRAEDAARAGEAMSGHASGVAVFSLEGEPAVDLWGGVQILARYGAAPKTAA